MYSGSISGAQALPNGNVLVTHGTQGTLYEVNRTGDIVWEYIGPVGPNGPYTQMEPIPDGNRAGTTANAIFKATHYPTDHPAFINRNLSGSDYIEHWNDDCPNQEAWGWDRDGDGCIDDSDDDGVLDPYDRCERGADNLDEDGDSVPDPCDSLVDTDGDGVANAEDRCEGHDDAVDADQDGVPEPCDDLIDSDNDTVADENDLCNGFDDTVDIDNDSIPDDCDDLLDSDGDGVADEEDVCVGGDDRSDADDDGVPDACDETPLPVVEDDQEDAVDEDVGTDQLSTEGEDSLLTTYAVEIAILTGLVLIALLRFANRASPP